MELLGSAESDTEAAGSRAPTWENLRGGITRLELGLRWRPVSPVCAWSVETIPMDLDREGRERVRDAARR